jgi:hypothetical protein
MIPEIKVKEGTFILFPHDLGWYMKDSEGKVSPCSDPSYAAKYNKEYACVLVDDPEDDAFISSLNGDYFTVVTDKYLVGRPNLLTFENTIEWNAMSQIRKLAKQTGFFCSMATKHYNPIMIKRNKHEGK